MFLAIVLVRVICATVLSIGSGPDSNGIGTLISMVNNFTSMVSSVQSANIPAI